MLNLFRSYFYASLGAPFKVSLNYGSQMFMGMGDNDVLRASTDSELFTFGVSWDGADLV